MNWIWQNLFSDVLFLLLTLAGGAFLAVLKKRGSQWFAPLLYGFCGSALIAVIIIAFVAITRIPKESEPITPGNVETNIRVWLDNFRLSTKKVEDSNTMFTLVATLNNGTPVGIGRYKSLDRYVILETTIVLAPEHKAMIEKLPKEEARRLSADLSVEMARSKIGFTIAEFPLNKIRLERRIPITANLTEGAFMSNIDEIDSAAILASSTIILGLERALGSKSRVQN